MRARTTVLPVIETDRISAGYRRKAIDLDAGELLITSFLGSEQAKDLTEPPNCGGLGRIRHFRRQSLIQGWPANPLPIDPACRALGLPFGAAMRAQVFQNAVCNWRCWYCFVDFDLLSANPKYSEWVSAHELVDRYLSQEDPPPMIDLTGGQPDLTPEWVPWMMDALEHRGLASQVYLWSDDNLSNDYFFRFLSEKQRNRIAAYEKYGRVCCFKGYNTESFAFNTRAAPSLFARQFDLMRRLLQLPLDIFAYVTLTTPDSANLADDMRNFMDRLQDLDENLPLRTVPLQIHAFSPVKPRLDPIKVQAMKHQDAAVEAWSLELTRRYPSSLLSTPVCDVPLGRRIVMPGRSG